MLELVKLLPGNSMQPAVPHNSVAYLTPGVCITAPEQSCLLAQPPQGNPSKLAQSCRASPRPCPHRLSGSKALPLIQPLHK